MKPYLAHGCCLKFSSSTICSSLWVIELGRLTRAFLCKDGGSKKLLKEIICKGVKADTTRCAQIILFLLSSLFVDIWLAIKIRVNGSSSLWKRGKERFE